MTEEKRSHGPTLFSDYWDPKRGEVLELARDGCRDRTRAN